MSQLTKDEFLNLNNIINYLDNIKGLRDYAEVLRGILQRFGTNQSLASAVAAYCGSADPGTVARTVYQAVPDNERPTYVAQLLTHLADSPPYLERRLREVDDATRKRWIEALSAPPIPCHKGTNLYITGTLEWCYVKEEVYRPSTNIPTGWRLPTLGELLDETCLDRRLGVTGSLGTLVWAGNDDELRFHLPTTQTPLIAFDIKADDYRGIRVVPYNFRAAMVVVRERKP